MLDRIEEKIIIPRPQPEETTHIELGKMLYNIVFSGELGEYFNKRFNEVQDENCGLRLSLQFSEDVPEIAALPWEYLHDGEDFLITRRSILLSRLPAGVKKTESKPLDSVLRMLVVISSPEDPKIPPLNTEKEQEIILEALDKLQKEQKIKVDFTEDATFENVQGYLNEQEYHIVHFTGHGVSRNGKGYLVFETEDRKARLIDNKILTDLFSDMGMRLVVLSSCESAKGSNKEAFSDLASMLSKRRIPAVVAMQYSVLDDVAIQFAYTFYRTIASGKSVDIALKEARIAMKNSEKSNGFDFATPVLYLSDCNCVQVGDIKPEPAEFVFKPTMLSDLQVMKTGFVARKKELRILEKGFRSDIRRAAIIHGFGGMGKTVLATRLALKMNEYFDGVFGMKCTSTTRPEDILTRINNFLMMKGRFELNQILNQPEPLETKTFVLINTLNQLRFLIILDNFEDCLDEDRKEIESPELKTFLQQLLNNTYTGTKFIITTRYDFDPLEGRLPESIEHISLPELHFPQTNWLMNKYTELANLDIRKKKQIYDIIGGHPWTIGKFAKLSSVQGVDSLMLDLKPLKKELMEFTLLEKSFSKLDSEAKKLLIYASIYDEAVPVEALSWIIGDEKDESPSIVEPLQKLIQWGLMSKEQEYDQTVYMEHTIVRNFAQDKLKEEGLDKKKLLIRAARYYENLVSQTGSLWDILKARDYYFEAEDFESASEIVESTSNLLIRWGHIELAMNLLNESINSTSGETKTNAEYTLATIYFHLGDLNTALKIYNNIRYKCEEWGDKNGFAGILHSLGMIHQDQGNYEEAVKLYNQSLKIAEELGNKSGIAHTLHKLGTIHQKQGNYEEAVKLYNQSLKIAEELGNKSGIAQTLHKLGTIHQKQGNYEEAVKLYNQSLKIKEELGDKNGFAITLHQLGRINEEEGEYSSALRNYLISFSIFEQLNSPNKEIVARSLLILRDKMGEKEFDAEFERLVGE
ncbi:NACHT domain-containing protein [Methanosarcina thermophila]|uniref:NACHT domain-containing protein n=1 Tax=Methanosarcina thermophila TaxID=2210 RepID=A0A1I7AII2_METTE|nr:tetratricopeptide repeat protein [Methanosarcina thermophila]SFT74747.1 NACHT domain-containing protein [Methanosarcina thermophila]